MWKFITLTATVAVATLAAGSAESAATVFGGGLAQACSKAALAGDSDKKAEETCTLALETELLNARDRAGTFVNRGVLKLRRAEFSPAAEDFDRAVGLQPRLGEAYVNRGAAAVAQRRYQEALADINRAIELGIEEPEKAYFNRALAYEGLDDMKAAYFDYQKALELKPDWQEPQKELVRFTVRPRE